MAATPEAAIPVDSDGNVSWLELGRHGLPHCVWRETYECKGSVEIPRRKQILADMGHLVHAPELVQRPHGHPARTTDALGMYLVSSCVHAGLP